MGFYSWLTADTKESIANAHTDRCRTVYLIQPDGKPAIEETAYDGYGRFGGTSAYTWLAKSNYTHEELVATLGEGYDDEELYSLGVSLELGTYYEDKEGNKWSFGNKPLYGLKGFEGDYGTPQPKYNDQTPNELLESGEWVERPLRDLDNSGKEFMPLKFSFNKDAVYEDLPFSRNCPNQGFFYPEESDISMAELAGVEHV